MRTLRQDSQLVKYKGITSKGENLRKSSKIAKMYCSICSGIK